jgi:hypothetical protein
MTIIRNITWAEDLGFASAPQRREYDHRRDGTADVVKAIVIGLALGVGIWAVLIAGYFYLVRSSG